MDLEAAVLDATADYGTLHAALVDFLMSMRTAEEKQLLKWTKMALLTLFCDAKIENETELAELDALLQSSRADSTFDPLPFFQSNSLSKVVSVANKKLAQLDFSIVQAKDMDIEGGVVYSFVNKRNEGAINAAGAYSPRTVELIRGALERIFGSDYVRPGSLEPITYAVPHMKMVNHVRDVGNTLTYDEAEQLVQTLELQGWFEQYHDKITVGPRALAELGCYLVETYKTVQEGGTVSMCVGCEQIVTRGYCCPNEQCYVRMHKHCKVLVKSSRESEACPNEACQETLGNYTVF